MQTRGSRTRESMSTTEYSTDDDYLDNIDTDIHSDSESFKPHIPDSAIERLWFEDGSVIIHDSSRRPICKVYRGILKQHSSVLSHMINERAVKNPDSSHGITITTLELTDSRVSLEPFLDVIYGNDRHWYSLKTPVFFPHFKVALLLAVKYKVKTMVASALQRLHHVFCPNTFHNIEATFFTGKIARFHAYKEIYAIAVVQLARACNAPKILPMAFYVCSSLSYKELTRGAIYEGNTWATLSPEDLAIIMTGRDMLTRRNLALSQTLIDIRRGPKCKTARRCPASLTKIASYIHGLDYFSDSRALWPLYELLEDDGCGYWKLVCRSCQEKVRIEIEREQNTTWENLGSYFGIEDWRK